MASPGQPMLPDFFIIGAPKAGTTALATYLGERPDIFMCEPKEPQYFTFDFPGHRGVDRLDDYEALFAPAGPQVRVRGDASVWYLYSRQAIPEIARLRPDARLLALLRRPDEMVVSLFAQQRQTGIESAPDFGSAWHLENERRAGSAIPAGCRTPEFLHYRSVARYGEQLARVFLHFPKAQVKIFLYEELCQDPLRVYQETLGFLGLAPDDRSEFPVVNPYADVHSPLFQTGLTWLLGHARDLNRRVQSRLGVDLRKIRIHQPVIETLQRLNLNLEAPRPLLDPKLRQEIIEAYAPDIRNLMTLTGRNLSHWLEPSSS